MSRLTEPSTKKAMRYHGHNTARRRCTHAERCVRHHVNGACALVPTAAAVMPVDIGARPPLPAGGVSPRASVAAYSSLKTGCAGAARMYSSSGAFADATVVSGAARDHQRVK